MPFVKIFRFSGQWQESRAWHRIPLKKTNLKRSDFIIMEQKYLSRINELAKLAKQRSLTPEELKERDELRKNYLSEFRKAFKQQLENTVVQYDDGTRVPLTELHKKKD